MSKTEVPPRERMKGGGILTYARVCHWISDDGDLNMLKPHAKLLALFLARSPRMTVEELKRATGLPMTKTKEGYQILLNAGTLDAIAREFYGDSYDDAVKMGRWPV